MNENNPMGKALFSAARSRPYHSAGSQSTKTSRRHWTSSHAICLTCTHEMLTTNGSPPCRMPTHSTPG